MEKQGLSHGWAQWEVLGLFVPREADLLSPKEWQITTHWRTRFLFFDRAVGALPWDGLVVSTGPPCSVRKEASWHQQKSKTWSLEFTCLCGSRVLALSSKLRVPVGQQS
jgi:hypothetical protein